MCWQSVECDSKEHAAQSNNPTKGQTCEKSVLATEYFWSSTDVLQGAQVVLEMGSTQRGAEQELNKKWWTKVMQSSSRHLEIRKKLCPEPDVSLKSQTSIQAGGVKVNGRHTQEVKI